MKKLLFALLYCIASGAQAAPTMITGVPTAWRLEDYAGDGNVVAWFTGSNCVNGQLTFPATATAADRNRFWSLLLTAKVAQKSIFVQYDNAIAGCPLISFGTDS